MNSIVWYFLVLFLAKSLEANRFRCDYKYNKAAGGYFKYQEVPAKWTEARLRCNLEGSVLASPLTRELQNAILSFTNKSCFQGVWTGINSMFSKGDYGSVEGVNLEDIPHIWMKCEPDNNEDEEGCLVMLSTGELADANCNETLPYICYKKTYPGMAMNSCGSPDNAYKFDKRTGKCYKFHTVPRIWSRAHMACKAEGGHLAIANSETEDQVLKEVFNAGPMPTNAPDADKSITFIGFYDWDKNGEWRTIDGQTLQEAGFEQWEPGQPSGKQYCGGMFKSGRFDDSHCEVRATFICEKDPESLTCDDERR